MKFFTRLRIVHWKNYYSILKTHSILDLAIRMGSNFDFFNNVSSKWLKEKTLNLVNLRIAFR